MSSATNLFNELVFSILKRPAMYGVNKVEDVYFIIQGFSFAIDSKTNELNEILTKFRTYVNARYQSKDNVDWCRLIRFYSGSDSHSLELFSGLFSDFLKEKSGSDQ